MIFAEPHMLYLGIVVLILPVAFALRERWRKHLLHAMVAMPKTGLIMGAGFERRMFSMALMAIGLALLVITLARPQWGTRLETLTHRGVDVILALDVSYSMLAQDLKPSRFEVASRAAQQFLNLLEGDRVGLIAFASSAYLTCPLTVDYGAARLFLSGMGPGMLGDGGTDARAALDCAREAFERSGGKGDWVLILFSDGEHHEGDVTTAVDRLVDDSVRLFTIGVGDPAGSGARIPEVGPDSAPAYKRDAEGDLIITRFEEERLSALAEMGQGVYFRGTESGKELGEIYRMVKGMRETEFTSRLHHQLEDRFQIPLLGGIVFLCLSYMLGNRSFRSERRTQEGAS